MAPIDDAIAEIELHKLGEHFSYWAIARKFGISNSTLTQRHKGQTNPQHEAALVQYINDLTERALPPTRKMIENSASQVATEPVSKAKVTRFLK
ncbi:hypothetical protein CC86DRAFT_427714 [Ophiobolus disseminans]|uniref:HTH CENPB-type domain-containing protein n=1 Tax=Ophiobolus disseminans TaxID=1469910 RepID=A0A6A6ZI66_9PLEO|nr:hypothetical protein CC86DRAFT_427714 [Ophiobolus disseminans]